MPNSNKLSALCVAPEGLTVSFLLHGFRSPGCWSFLYEKWRNALLLNKYILFWEDRMGEIIELNLCGAKFRVAKHIILGHS